MWWMYVVEDVCGGDSRGSVVVVVVVVVVVKTFVFLFPPALAKRQ
jgi:hypothetical protein